MYKLLILMLSSLLSCQALAATTDQMLRHADNYRLQEGSARVMTVVRLYKNQVLDKTHLYEVYARPDRQSLVLFKSRTEAGQKLLMLGDNYWLLMPKSRRPIRITPMQKLLGEASVGDISSLRWRDDYQATLTGPATLTLNGKLSESQSAGTGVKNQRCQLRTDYFMAGSGK